MQETQVQSLGREGLLETGMAMWASLVAQMVKRLPTMRETWVQSLGLEDLVEKEMATHSSTLAWKIPWTEEPGRLQSMGSQRVRHNWATSLSLSFTLDHRKSKRISEHWLRFIDYNKAFDCVDHNKLGEILKRAGNTRQPYLPPVKSVDRSRSNS